ncbi:hypothetical protein DB347_02665 [Opitutaceae bacterium EW11]|nr:hypothetical protein DB347_02665 [Opitutaceae bacterium EW11]
MKLPRKIVLTGWILGALVVGIVAFWSLARPHRHAAAASAIIGVKELSETSGLAVSRRTEDVIWGHNDSKGEPVLYGFAADGQPRARLRVVGAKNLDWEALAPFQFEGRSWIAIGDIGDNFQGRRYAQIYVIEEPGADRLSASQETPVEIAWSIRFRFEDGAHDCEALAADPRLHQFLLITKFTRSHGVYTLPLQPIGTGVMTAKRIATLAGVPRPSAIHRIFPSPTGRYRNEPTDACLSSDGRTLAVLTYSEILLYRRGAGERWETVVTREPEHFAVHGLPQAEAMAFTPDDRSLYVTGEQKSPKLLRFDGP